MTYIELSGKRGKGHRTLVDEETFNKWAHLTWHLSDTGYAVRRTREGTVRLHRLVANTPEGLFTDHKNHDKLDNRISNLRVVTQKENMANYKGARGYCWDSSKKLWLVTYRGRFYGRYKSEREAQKASLEARAGIPKIDRMHPRRKYLPKGVYFMQPQAQKSLPPYYIRPQLKGKKYFQGYFVSVQEAEEAYNKFIAQGGLTP